MPHVGKKIRRTLTLTCAFTCSLLAPLGTASAVSAAPSMQSGSNALPARGDHSAAVARLQTLLIAAGVKVRGGSDGMFGAATSTAVSAFQRSRGLSPTGKVDAATAIAVGLVPPVPLLAPGATGPEVIAVQRQLIDVGLRPKGGADGQYGPGTAERVRAFQTQVKVTPTGAVDAYTAALLASRAAAPAAAPEPTVLGPGASGAAVERVQRQLIAAGLRPKGGVDGRYGAATVSSVKVFQRWNGLPITGTVDARTAAALAAAAGSATAPALAHFPLPRTCMFWDTWGAPRAGGRRHQGTDIFARRGAPIYAVADGRITRLRYDRPGSRGGNQFWLTAKDGTTYFYGHLDGFADGIGVGVPVRAGDVIGYAGKTGLTTVVHLHFEVHPHGGAPVNPYQILLRSSGCRSGQ
ncbi:MAG: peptidoglycan-binding protein [Ilumatobacteraceae bacterium]